MDEELKPSKIFKIDDIKLRMGLIKGDHIQGPNNSDNSPSSSEFQSAPFDGWTGADIIAGTGTGDTINEADHTPTY